MVCYGNRTPLYEGVVKDGFEYLKNTEKISGDDLNCFLLAYELLKINNINDIVDLDLFKELLCNAINNTICKDVEKYGVEYVPMPSSIFAGIYLELLTPEIKSLIIAEKDILGKLQMDDGGFDITWKWYTPYPDEYEQARAWWRPRITIEKLLFNEVQI